MNKTKKLKHIENFLMLYELGKIKDVEEEIKKESHFYQLILRLREKIIPANGVMKQAGLSYKMINDWDSMDILDSKRDGKKGWRRFSAFGIVNIAIINKARKIGIPLFAMEKFIKWLNADSVAENSLCQIIAGFKIYLLTNFIDTFQILSDFEVAEMLGQDKQSNTWILIPINPIYDEIFELLEIPKFEINHSVKAEIKSKENNKWVTNYNPFGEKRKDIRCAKCHKKLGEKDVFSGTFKCPKCKHINVIKN